MNLNQEENQSKKLETPHLFGTESKSGFFIFESESKYGNIKL